MATLPETEQRRQYTDRDLGLIEGRQEQGLRRLDDMSESMREMNRKIDRYFLTLLTITVGGFIAVITLIVNS